MTYSRHFSASALFAFVVAFGLFGVASSASANHSWNGYHWARTANPFTLKLENNTNSVNWTNRLTRASADWSRSTILDTTIVSSNGTKGCVPSLGRVEVCAKKYGTTGWLGIAGVFISGNHITRGFVEMNNTYFSATTTYNTTAWRQLVMCQEVAHTFGLAHQDTDFSNANLGSCMDYTNDPDGTLYSQLSNMHPNQHDYQELGIIYKHLDATTTIDTTTAIAQAAFAPATQDQDEEIGFEDASKWGKEMERSANGRSSVYERDLGQGQRVLTHVFWAEPRGNAKK